MILIDPCLISARRGRRTDWRLEVSGSAKDIAALSVLHRTRIVRCISSTDSPVDSSGFSNRRRDRASRYVDTREGDRTGCRGLLLLHFVRRTREEGRIGELKHVFQENTRERRIDDRRGREVLRTGQLLTVARAHQVRSSQRGRKTTRSSSLTDEVADVIDGARRG